MQIVWFSVLFFIIINGVFADRDCSNLGNIKNCDECFRCYGKWCNDPDEEVHCFKEGNKCKKHLEKSSFHMRVENGTFLYPKYRMRTVKSGGVDISNIDFEYANGKPNVTITTNSTQTLDFFLNNETKCDAGRCTVAVETIPSYNFCLPNGGTHEFLNMTLTIDGIQEEAEFKYHVPCACECSAKVELRSPACNERGSFSCGVCTCDKEWTGNFCEEPVCEGNRGDTPSEHACSGNGVYNACGKCDCFTDKAGSRYFDRDGDCADLCQVTSIFDLCFNNPKPGRCEEHLEANLYYQTKNETLMTESDMYGPLWVICNITFNDCLIEYAAMKNGSDTHYMITRNCDPHTGQVVSAVNVTMPIVLGVVALAAATAATAAYLIWKNRSPPLPMSDPMYQNIDAEDCTGENPLYKPPTSSFKNPTYGKW